MAKANAAMTAEAGIVSTQAQRMLMASPQRTAFIRWMLPTPAMEPAMTWVVETGCLRIVAKRMEIAAAVYAQNPPRGLSLVRRLPIVWIIRHPPLIVPRAIAA
jgi:hypothetical protein